MSKISHRPKRHKTHRRRTTIPVTHSIVTEVADPPSDVDATAFAVPSPIVSAVTSTLYAVTLGCQPSILHTPSTTPVEAGSAEALVGGYGGSASSKISEFIGSRVVDCGGSSQGEGMVQSGSEEQSLRMPWSFAMVL